MTRAHRTDAVVESDRSIRATGLPFAPGDKVEIIILAPVPEDTPAPSARYPLQGTPYHFDDPFSPMVDPDEWGANR